METIIPAREQYPSGYKILRSINGKMTEIELTSRELHEAFLFQEKSFREEDIRNMLEDAENDGELELNGKSAQKIIESSAMFNQMVSTYAKNCDKYNMEWHEGAKDAISTVLSEFEDEKL
jgi:uncharacterized protein YpuA (DUF1002 family)